MSKYQFPDGRIIIKPTKEYPTIDDCISDLSDMPKDHVEFYAHYFGWYSDNNMYGHSVKTGELTTRLAKAARAEFARRSSDVPGFQHDRQSQ